MTSEVDHDEVIAHVRRSFAFLEDDVVVKVRVKDGALDCLITYVTALISVEVHVEWHDPIAVVSIARTIGRRPAPGWQLHEGRLMRVYLGEALRRGDETDWAVLREWTQRHGKRRKRGQADVLNSITEQAEIVHGMRDRFAFFHARLFPD